MEAPSIDSHCAIVVQNKMYVFGGFIADGKGKYSNDFYTFQFDT